MDASSSTRIVAKKKDLDFKELTRGYFKLYCDRSTIHGVRYLFNDDLNSIERFCWTGIVITSITVTIICYLILAQRYSEQLLLTIVDDSQYPVYNMLFPAVAVCPQKRVHWPKFQKAKELYLPPDASNETRAIFHDFVKRMDTLRFGSFSQFSQLDRVDVERIDFINITSLAMFLTIDCEEMFEDECYWRKEKYPCCEIFVWEKTETGGCLVFNSAISGASRKKMEEDPFYPWRNSKSGEDTGLEFSLKSEDGIFLMIKKAEQWSDVIYSIEGNTDAVVVVRPEYTTTELNARAVPIEKRGCIYDTETDHPLFKNIQGLKYLQRNCLNVCHEEHLMQHCNCTISMFFPWNDTRKECRPSDYRCIYNYRGVFGFDKRLYEDQFVKNIKGGMLCPCLVSCDALQYFVTVSTIPIVNRPKNETPIITVDVHYQSEIALKFRTSREFTYLELIASFGGIVGLFLGSSIVSAIEVFYHLTFGLIIYLKTNHCFVLAWRHLARFCRSLRKANKTQPTTMSASSTQPKRAWHKSTSRRRY